MNERGMDPGRLEAVLAMADALDTIDERTAVVIGYHRDEYDDLAMDAKYAWDTLLRAEFVVMVLYYRITCGMNGVYRNGEEL